MNGLKSIAAFAFVVSHVVHAPSAAAAPDLVVVDANGTRVGQAHPSGSSFVVAVEAEGKIVVLDVRKDRFPGGLLFYSEPDCQGTPYSQYACATRFFDESLGESAAAVGPPGQTLYFRREPCTQLNDFPYRSIFVGDGRGCINGDGTTPEAVPMRAVTDLLDHFTPPFHLQPSARVVDVADGSGDCGSGS
jgi:hypothetical protein